MVKKQWIMISFILSVMIYSLSCGLIPIKDDLGCVCSSSRDYYKTGKLKSCNLKNEQAIQGIKCSAKWNTKVYFYNTGKLYRCTLAEPQVIQNIPCKAGSKATFYNNGKLLQFILPGPKKIQGIKVARDKENFLYKNGKLRFCFLAEDTKIQGLTLGAGSSISFHENGKFKSGYIKKRIKAKKIKFPANTLISLDKKGKLWHCKLTNAQEIQGKKFKKGTELYFYKNGMVKKYYHATPRYQSWEEGYGANRKKSYLRMEDKVEDGCFDKSGEYIDCFNINKELKQIKEKDESINNEIRKFRKDENPWKG